MATWEDGPEYAPAERPDAFTAPETARPLEQAPPRRAPADHAPAGPAGRGAPQAPRFAEPEKIEPLHRYHPDPGPQRDPQEPYAVARGTMTEADSAWAVVQDYHVQPAAGQGAPPTGPPAPPVPDPHAPILVAGARTPAIAPHPPPSRPPAPHQFPATAQFPPPHQPPGPGQLPAPTPATQPERLPQRPVGPAESGVRFGDVFDGVTVPTFLTLVIGGTAMAIPFFGWMSPLMFLLAFGTAGQIPYRRHWVRNTFLVAAGALGTTVGAGLLMFPGDLLVFFELVYAVSTAICWLVLAALFLIVWQALAHGEQPTPPPSRRSGWD